MAYDLENLINSWPNCWEYLCKIWFKCIKSQELSSS